MKNPNALIIQGNGTTLTNGTYDGSAAKTVNITPASIGALAANGTAVKATADANGKNIASTYETKTNVTTKVSEALNTAKDYTDTSISSLVNGAPEHLNTLKELADALGADENMSTTIVGMISGKADKVHSHEISDVNGLSARLGGIEEELGNKIELPEIQPIVLDSIRAEAGSNMGTVGTPSVSSRVDGDDVVFTFDYLKGVKGDNENFKSRFFSGRRKFDGVRF